MAISHSAGLGGEFPRAGRLAGRICFSCPVDIETMLALIPPELIVASATRLMKAFGSANGGYRLQFSIRPIHAQE